MKTRYLPTFIKDLKAIKGLPVYAKIKTLVLETIPAIDRFDAIPHVKKLRDRDCMYRIRVGNYRVGFSWDGETIVFMRALHRKDIYRFFS